MRQKISDYWELTKPGVTFMVVISTLGGFYLASDGGPDFVRLLHTLLGSWLVAAGTNAMNQFVEREYDRSMKRTMNRPLPAGRLQANHVLVFAAAISVIGTLYLGFATNPLTGLLAALTFTCYIFIYTPMKRITSWSTVIGAVPGALPAMGGWVAVTGTVAPEAWILFGILFFWQLPHFLAIAWIYRDDYERGGFKVFPLTDSEAYFQTSFHIVANCIALIAVSALPSIVGITGHIYLAGALILGSVFLIAGVQMVVHKNNQYAKKLLFASIAYLPILMLLMFLDKIPT